MRTYTLYLYPTHNWDEKPIAFFDTMGTNMSYVYNEFGKEIVEIALKKGTSIKEQAVLYSKYINGLNRRKANCYKIRGSDLLIYLCCYTALHKFNMLYLVDVEAIFYMKKKKKKLIKT
tara:strand:- start:567 stop:920 length:354 start_codon:yes stop_codon:yes gene_type:complete